MTDKADQHTEDTRDDVLRKAFSMVGISPSPLPENSSTLDHFLKETLRLSPSAWRSMTDSIPTHPLPSGLTRHILPFDGWTLNIWTLDTPEGQVVIDSGLSPEQLISASSHQQPSAILITHLHRDHIGGITAYPRTPIYAPPSTRPRSSLEISGLEWQVFDLAGHTPEGIGWLTEYKGTKLFFPGDSIFARSIGKCKGSEHLAMTNIIKAMDILSPETIICPGHGPTTTAADEWRFNPFIAPYRH